MRTLSETDEFIEYKKLSITLVSYTLKQRNTIYVYEIVLVAILYVFREVRRKRYGHRIIIEYAGLSSVKQFRKIVA